jgi:hypothetical protein
MILMTYSTGKVLIGILFVTLALLVLYIAYRKFLRFLGKGEPVKEDYCVLYSLEAPISRGTVEIYFTTEQSKKVRIEILKEDLSFEALVKEGDFSIGGHIVRFNTEQLADGIYYYCLLAENQKTIKRMEICNS